MEFVLQLCPVGTIVTLYTEPGNEMNFWGRQLAYVVLPDGTYLNDLLIQNGYAKAASEYYCKELSRYQQENWTSKLEKRGLYTLSEIFQKYILKWFLHLTF
jgi:micrococcal nuclease